MKHFLLAALILSGFLPSVWAAQLDADILVDNESMSPTFSFLRIIYIEYPDGGEIAHLLQGKNQTISFSADSRIDDMPRLKSQLNENLKSLPSTVFVTDVKLNYQAILSGHEKSAVVEINLELIPTMANSIMKRDGDSRIIDANWRGLTLETPVMLETQYGEFDINNPQDALEKMAPDVLNKFQHSSIEILEIPLINSSEILNLPLYKWHSLFDNTAIIPTAELVNFTGEHVITYYSMGECNLEIGFCQDREWIKEMELDKKYRIMMIESRDDASIAIEGYVENSSIGSIETFNAKLSAPVNSTPVIDKFPAAIMYGMAGLAAIGGVGMFLFSNRKLKKDHDQGQTGIDPANLMAYEISTSAGGYRTNRGEAVLVNPEISKMPV